MKRFVKIGLLFLLLSTIVLISALRWYHSYSVREQLSDFKIQVEDLLADSNQLYLALSENRIKINNDKINTIIQQLDLGLDRLERHKTLRELPYLNHQILQIKKNYQQEREWSEDFVQTNAVLKNSLSYLIESTHEILHNHGNISKDNPFFKELQNVLFNYFRGTLTPIVPQQKAYNSVAEYMLDQHIRVLSQKYFELQKIDTSLNQQKLQKSLSFLDQKITAQFIKMTASERQLFILLLISAVVLLIAALIANLKHMKERRISIAVKNDMEQFAKALNISAVVSKTDLEGTITYVNDNFCQLSGYTQEELLGQKHSIIRHPDMPDALFKNLWKNISQKKVFKATLKNQAKDGSAYYVDSVVMPLLTPEGEIKEYIAVRYDVTELVTTRDNAIASQIAKDEFFSNMSHELRTPLNAIIGFSQLLSFALKEEKTKKQANAIYDSGIHLLKLINDILDLSKMNSGKFSIIAEPFVLQTEINTLLIRYNTQIKQKEIRFNLILPSQSLTLAGDWLRISQVITNLLSNAIKFTPQKGMITLTLAYQDNILLISVRDTGIGMNEKVLKRIFYSFEQADNTTTRNYGGTGLGLSIVYQLIHLMHGSIQVDSQENVGSIFEVSLPLNLIDDTDILHQALSESPKDHLTPRHILVVEDNQLNQELVVNLLDSFGLKSSVANDGKEAVEMAQHDTFDLILMDESMPNMNGIEAMQKIRQLHIDIPIIALSANAMKGDKQRFIDAGMDDFVSKPISYDKLYKVLKKYLKQI